MRTLPRLPFRLLALVAAVGVACGTLSAHLVNLGAARGRLVGDSFTFAIDLSPAELGRRLPDAPKPPWNDRAFESLRPALVALAPQLWEVKADGAPTPAVKVAVTSRADGAVSFELTYLRLGARQVSLRARELAPGRRELVTIAGPDGAPQLEKVLTAGDDMLEFKISPWGELMSDTGTTSAGRSALSFVGLGIEHIWTGYDHLLFLFGLLVVCRSFRSIVSIISCFTLAHSLTLGLATLGVVNVASRITEPAIAASIVFVSVENLVRRGAEPRGRWAVTFAFGLIHGFGFATVLRDLGVGMHGDSIAVPLFSFNLGVELGQIAIAAVALPLLWQLRKNARFVRIGIPALSALSALAGTYWFLERTVF